MKGILFDIPSPSFLGEDHPPGSDAHAPNPHLVGIFIPDPIWWGGDASPASPMVDPPLNKPLINTGYTRKSLSPA